MKHAVILFVAAFAAGASLASGSLERDVANTQSYEKKTTFANIFTEKDRRNGLSLSNV